YLSKKIREDCILVTRDDFNVFICIIDNFITYEEFYDELDNRLGIEQSMNMIFFGPPSSFLRLDPDSILHILTHTKKYMVPIGRALLAWDIITDGKTAAFLQGREYLAFGSLLDVVPEEDLYYVNFGDPSVLKHFASYYIKLQPRKYGILAAAYRRYFGESWYHNSSLINELGYLLCGFPASDLAKISPTTFKEISYEILSKAGKCNIKQTRALYAIAVHGDAYGEPYKWSSHEIGIPKIDISSIQLEAVTAISPEVMTAMNKEKLEYFTKQQILRMNPKTRRIYILRMQLKHTYSMNDVARQKKYFYWLKMPPVKHYSSSEVNQYELSSRLLSLTENNTSYTLTQINGQRIYRKAPHAWSGPEPSRNCEVFIGRIPHDCFEDTLVPLFRQAGELFEFRLMINFSGWNRGYAFAMYTTDAEASNAIRMFNNYMIRPSWQLGVCPSINNCRIFISRIPPTTPSAEIIRLLYALTDEVQEVRIRRSIASCAAIVEYKSHRGAAMARKALVAAAAAAWGCGARPAVDWSLPQSPQLLKQYREVFHFCTKTCVSGIDDMVANLYYIKVGRWTPERGVELTRAPEEPATTSPPPAAPSYTLEPWSQARRLRMIHEAQRSAAAAAEWSNRINNGMESLVSSMTSLGFGGGLGLAGREAGVWAPPGAPGTGLGAPRMPTPPQPRDFNPWTARHPLQEFITPGKDSQ
ncbi:hypothetical protein SFRURICE_019096, partial [Spodoptera frugiperda]